MRNLNDASIFCRVKRFQRTGPIGEKRLAATTRCRTNAVLHSLHKLQRYFVSVLIIILHMLCVLIKEKWLVLYRRMCVIVCNEGFVFLLLLVTTSTGGALFTVNANKNVLLTPRFINTCRLRLLGLFIFDLFQPSALQRMWGVMRSIINCTLLQI